MSAAEEDVTGEALTEQIARRMKHNQLTAESQARNPYYKGISGERLEIPTLEERDRPVVPNQGCPNGRLNENDVAQSVDTAKPTTPEPPFDSTDPNAEP